MRPTLLHVTNGESAGNTLRQTGLGGAVLPWQDILHEGPIPALPRAELLRKRARFLADCGWGHQQALASSLERRDQQLLDALRDDAHVVLWFEQDLYDQLQLLDVLTLAHTAEAAPELIVIGSFPGKPSFSGLGELTARELETLWPSRRPAEPTSASRTPGDGTPPNTSSFRHLGTRRQLPSARGKAQSGFPGAAGGVTLTGSPTRPEPVLGLRAMSWRDEGA